MKNRTHNHESSVILKCFNFNRHWSSVFKKKNELNFEEKIPKLFWRGATTGNEERIVIDFYLLINGLIRIKI